MKIYATYTQRFIVNGSFLEDTSLNGFYDLSFFLIYPQYQLPTLNVIDGINTTIGKFLIAEYNENIISKENIDLYLANIPKEFNINVMTKEETSKLLSGSYREESLGVFVLSEEIPGMRGEIIPAQYITIE